MDLQNIKVKELSLAESKETQGGFLLAVALGLAIGVGIGWLIFGRD